MILRIFWIDLPDFKRFTDASRSKPLCVDYKKSMKHKVLILTALTALAFFFASQWNLLDAQCPMCKLSAESNLKNGGTLGRGLNAGILYMLAMPYIVVASLGYWWWRNKRKESLVRVTFTEEEMTRYN